MDKVDKVDKKKYPNQPLFLPQPNLLGQGSNEERGLGDNSSPSEDALNRIKSHKNEVNKNILAKIKQFNQEGQEITEEAVEDKEPILPKINIKEDILQYLDSKKDIINIEQIKIDLKIDDEVIESLKRDGIIYEIRSGFVQKL